MEEKKIITVTVVDNFIEAQKRADQANKAFDNFSKTGKKNEVQQRALAKELAIANEQFSKAKKGLENAAKANDVLIIGDKK